MEYKIIKNTPLTFTPIKIELTLDTVEELNEFQGRLNTSLKEIVSSLEESGQSIGKVDLEDDPFYDLWDDLDSIQLSLKGEEE